MRAPSESDIDEPEPVEPTERDGHESVLPGVARSVPTHGRVRPPDTAPGHPGRVRDGDTIGGKYVVEGQLGTGGMGRVLRVRHTALGKAFALKVIRSAMATDQRIRELFYREARLASALAHDNICSIVDFGQDDRVGLYMVMELLEGQTVHARLREGGKLPAKVACDIMWQISDAVRFIHSRQILHGDIKAENIFLVRTPAQRRLAKLLDFGLSRADLGRNDGIDGTPEYLAPERIEGAAASQASDLYALGMVFFEMLTGKLPFTGDVHDVYRQHVEVPCPVPSEHGAGEDLDERADQIISCTSCAPSWACSA
jgi:eukaryotic-like serine/threonine-protein kinase